MAQFGNTEVHGTLSVAGKIVTREIVTDDGFTISGGMKIEGYEGSGTTLALLDSNGAIKRDSWFTADSSAIIVKPSSTVKGICYTSGDKENGGFYGGAVDPTAGTTTRLNYEGYFYASRVYNAFWNDIADFITVEEDTEIEFGKAYTYDGKHRKTNKCGEKSLGIASDTYGFGVGMNSDKKQIPIAIGGFALAFTDTIYSFGTPLVAGKNGILTKANFLVRLFNPEKIIAIFYKEEKEAMYNNILVKNRHWVKVC